MNKIYFIVGAVFLQLNFAKAQYINDGSAKGFIYNKERGLDLRIHTARGWNVGYTQGDIKTYFKTTYYKISLGELRHYKETIKTSDYGGFQPQQGFNSYSYGKQNDCFPVRLSYGIKRYYSEKASRNGVAIAINYSGGLTVAIMKPYYVDINTGREPAISIKYTDATAKTFLDPTQILGESSFFKGFTEVSVIPGVHTQVGVHLDWGAFDEFLKAVEVGAMLDIFPKKLPIMANEQNLPYFLNFYISVQLGVRQ